MVREPDREGKPKDETGTRVRGDQAAAPAAKEVRDAGESKSATPFAATTGAPPHL